MPADIPFNRPTLSGLESAYVQEALGSGHVSADGPFTRRVEDALQAYLGAPRVFLTHSCTAALELAALLTVEPGDEVILPSFTYPTTASAFARCGATLVFVDICADTFNIDPSAARAAVTPRTRAIVAVHYAGVGCDLEPLSECVDGAQVALIEDAAHGFGAHHRDRPLGTSGALAALSFHATKNVMSGEGGALIVNDPRLVARAQVIRDRGTNREQFVRDEVPEYNWVDLGSAFAPSDVIAAFLLAQVEKVDAITAARLRLWTRYHEAFALLEEKQLARRPVVPAAARHNGHIYHLLVPDAAGRQALLGQLAREGVGATFHYVPLHTSPAGRKYGRPSGSLATTEDVAGRMVRLPLHPSLTERDQGKVIDSVMRALIS